MKWNDWLARTMRQNSEAASGAASGEAPVDTAGAAGAVSEPAGADGDQSAQGEGSGGNQPASPSGAPDAFSGLSDENAAWAKKKGYEAHGEKWTDELINSQRHLEKLLGGGKENLFRKPDENSPQEVKDAWNDALGVPKTADDYEAVEGIEKDDPIYKAYADVAHKAGISDAAFKSLVQSTLEMSAEQVAQEENTFSDTLDVFAAQNPAQMQQIRAAFARVGATEDEVARTMTGPVAQRSEALYKLFAKMASGTAESRNPLPDDAGQRSMGMTAEQAQEKIDSAMNDDVFMKRYRSKNEKTRMAAVDEILRLRAIVSGGGQ